LEKSYHFFTARANPHTGKAVSHTGMANPHKTKMEDIKKWRVDNLLPNSSIKRMNMPKK
jgi:hypothetical protein